MGLGLTTAELRRAAKKNPEHAATLLWEFRHAVLRYPFTGTWWEKPEAMRNRLLSQADEWGQLLRDEYKFDLPAMM